MEELKILKLGEPVLRKVCAPVDPSEINDEFRGLLDQMFDLMYEANGVGLAAPQVGISKRFFVIVSDDDVERVFINPQIIKTSAETGPYDEGCLSIPGESETIIRPLKVTVSALDQNGKPFTLEADKLLARIIQHEYDHLDGIVYIDRGDKEVAQKIEEKFAKKAEKALEKAKAKAAKNAKIQAKLAAKAAKKNS